MGTLLHHLLMLSGFAGICILIVGAFVVWLVVLMRLVDWADDELGAAGVAIAFVLYFGVSSGILAYISFLLAGAAWK